MPDRFPGGSHRRLDAWKLGMDLTVEIYRVSANFPDDEKYGLTAQIRRAAVSVPSNIAEGNQRRSAKDQQRFLAVAKGSVAEVATQLEIAMRLDFLEEGAADAAIDLLDRTGRVLTNFYRSLSPGNDRP